MDANLVYRSIDLDETEEQVTDAPSRMMGYHLINVSAGTRYVHFYDALIADVTVGTTVPKLTIAIPAASDRTFSVPGGIRFDIGIAAAATTGVSGTGSPGNNDVLMNVAYLTP